MGVPSQLTDVVRVSRHLRREWRCRQLLMASSNLHKLISTHPRASHLLSTTPCSFSSPPLYQVPSWQPGHWCGNVEPILGEGSAPIIPASVHALPPSVVFGLCGEIVEARADKANHNLVPSLSVQLDPIQPRKYEKDENVGQIRRCV